MSNHHDFNFKQLMAHRSFFEPFIKTYLPKELLDRVDWRSLSLYKMGGKHIEENTSKEFESDVIYLVNLDKESAFLWVHCEHQSLPDKLMTLRIIQYQTAELLAYAKQNPGKGLPTIITIIYHQGETPWPYSLDIKALFAEPEVAIKYFSRPILVDLPATSDEELKRHQNIGAVEMILKHVRRKEFEKRLHIVLSELRTVDDRSRKTVLKYLIQVADISEAALLEAAQKCLPQDKELIMTVAEQIAQRSFQSGIQEGCKAEKIEIARNMLLKGFDDSSVCELTKLSSEIIVTLKKEIKH